MMYKTTFNEFSCMQNPFLMLNFQLQVKVMSKSRYPYNAILKIELLNYL